jgi:DNA-binding GntR family transcriptional regulator
MNDVALEHERLRQQLLLRALWGEVGHVEVGGWLRDAAPRAARGLQAYRANAGALAERALAAAFPTVVQLVGDESFAGLARALWFAEPPERGDMAQWGAALPAFIAASAQLAGEPYLADVARLDWAVHGAEQAAERVAAATGLERLADAEPAALRLRLAAALSLVSSPHPVATIWHAHRLSAPDRFEPVREAFTRAAGEHALVWRDGYKAQISILPEATARFIQATLDGRSLGRALDLAGADFAFEPWLLAALRQGWLQAVEAVSHG